MAKDDYYVIVYQILAYLYQCLKSGTDIDTEMLMPDSHLLRVNEKYWQYIIYNLTKDGYIEGVKIITMDNLDTAYVASIENCMITPKGIEYLCENSTIKKAIKYLKEIKAIVPFNL